MWNWAPLDVLVLDMPPGTGDAQLTIAQRVPLNGAVIVSTPQDIALIDAKKAITMFQKTKVPILGDRREYDRCSPAPVAAQSPCDFRPWRGPRHRRKQLGAPFLGEIPLVPRIRELSDSGRPVAVTVPDGPEAAAFLAIAEKIGAALETSGRAAPKIVLE